MALAHSPRIITDGLVLCLDAANSKSYPGSGTTWRDISGNGNNGTLVNGPTFNSANGGNIVFDGSNDYVSISLETLTNFTVSLWINILSFSGERQLFSSPNDSLGITTFGGKYMVYNGAINSGQTSIVNNIWKNVVVTTESTSVKLYLNSNIDGHWDNGRSISGGTCYICAYQGSSRQLNASVSSAVIYTRALSAAEIQQNFNALRGRYGI
jgi:hypothetical protein